MARFTDEVIERIKQDVSLVRLVESSGVGLKSHGQDKIGHCPFHDDKTPSLVISPDSNLWHCLGACQTGGSVVDWVMKTQGVSFRHAVEILRADIPALAAFEKPIKKTTTKKLEVLLSEDTEAQQLLNQVIEYYHETLLQSPDALAYLESRGLDDMELIKRFKLGFSNRTLAYRLPEKNRKAGAEIRGKLQDVGLLRKSGHEHFNGSITVPIYDTEHKVCEVYGRKLHGSRLRKGTAQHLYLPGEHAGVWNAESFQGEKEIILCEALIDAMTFWVHGYHHVTASYGTSGFTSDHLALFKQCGVERVLIAYDRDEAGNQAADTLAKTLQKEGFACYRVQFPKGMDVNQYAQEVTPASKSLGIVIRSAEWMGQGKAPERQLSLEIQTTSVSSGAIASNETPLALSTETVESETIAPAQAVPDVPKSDINATVSDREITFTFGTRNYRVRGLEKNKNYEVMKVNVLVSCEDNLHVDSFDLYAAKFRQSFIKVAALELKVEENTLKKDLGKVLLKLEELQERLIHGAIEEQKKDTTLSDNDKENALELLCDPNLLERITSDFSRCGVVGEATNTLVGYLAASSRKLDKPLAIVIQSTSAAGKSSLMDAVLDMMPEDERVQYSAMTGQSLFYMGETNLKHKILAIAEEEGASNASYALKLLQSEGQITIASTGKDESTGTMVTKEYTVEGPVMLFFTTTAIDIDEELLNRCTLLTVNESREQTRAIHEAQRRKRTLSGLQEKLEKQAIVKRHRDAQTLLRPLSIINPYADQLTFLDDKTRTRRDHEKYLTLIDSIAFLHQYQREIKTLSYGGKPVEFIEVQVSDIDMANTLAHEVLGRTLDELPAQTRKLLKRIQVMVTEACKAQTMEQKDVRFSRRDIREFTGWSDGQLKIHCGRLTELEYLLVHRGGRGMNIVYELLFDGCDDDQLQCMGLIKTEKLQYDAQTLGQKDQTLGSSQAQVRAKSESGVSLKPMNGKALEQSELETPENIVLAKNTRASHRTHTEATV